MRDPLSKLLLPAGLAVGLVAGLVLACRSAKPSDSRLTLEPAAVPRAWTTAFQREAVLVADEVFIEGPSDLIEHVALRQDDETTVYTTRTVTEGLRQELATRPDSGVEVRAQLDGWAIAALRKITVLQRPGDVPVTVRASGNAYWAAADGSGTRREAELVFQGFLGK